jgi:hypothetical protein
MQMNTTYRRVAPGLLAAALAAGCGTTEIGSVTSDRIIPQVTVAIQGTTGKAGSDSVSLRAPLSVAIDAKDNAALQWVVTRVFADTTLVGRDSSDVPARSSRSAPPPATAPATPVKG